MLWLFSDVSERICRGAMGDTFFDGWCTSDENIANEATLLGARARYDI
jgi:hypothetical protein